MRKALLLNVKPGVMAKEVDSAARSYIESKGYGECFGHGLGHGVGLEVHEDPVINKRSKEILEAGMVFTVEPGIYIPGWGGIRIEDIVLVTKDGCNVLSHLPKSLKRYQKECINEYYRQSKAANFNYE